MRNWKASLTATAVGAMSGIAFGILGFLFLAPRQYPNMGAALFWMVPVAAGFSIAMVARKPDSAVAAALLSVVSSLVVLIGLGKEGVLCAVLAFPIILVGVFIGIGIGMLVRKLFVSHAKNQTTTTGILLLAAPIMVLAGERMERPMLQHPRIEVIQTAVEVNDRPEKVWGNILSIQSV